MDDERLSEQGSDFERELLRAGRSDRMPERSGRLILATLGLASPAAAAGTAATAGKLITLKVAFVAAGVGAIGAGAILGGQRLLADQAPASSTPLETVIDAPVEPTVHQETAPQERASVPATSLEKAPQAEAASAPRAVISAAPTKVDTLPLELEAIDRARSALASGNHTLASRLLDGYRTRFPKPHLRAEATVLRIETLVARGDRQGAARLGTAFLKGSPNGPYARRVRSLVGDVSNEAFSKSSPNEQ